MTNENTTLFDGSLKTRDAGTGPMHHVKKLLKLFFSSYGVLMTSISIMALAVLNGDAFSSFTGGLIVNMDDFLHSLGDQFAYPIALLISAIALLGPLHYYGMYNKIDLIVILIIVLFLTGFALGRMFRHPAWALVSGFVVMASFIILFTSLMGILDYASQSIFGMPVPVSSIIYSLIGGVYGMPIGEVFFYVIIENGLFLGICGAFWGVIFMPGKKKNDFSTPFNCDAGKVCKV